MKQGTRLRLLSFTLKEAEMEAEDRKLQKKSADVTP